jgi:hypothetical protein
MVEGENVREVEGDIMEEVQIGLLLVVVHRSSRDTREQWQLSVQRVQHHVHLLTLQPVLWL